MPKPLADTRFRFVSRRPFLRTTVKPSTTTLTDLSNEPTNQQSLEENFDGVSDETTQLGEIALALQGLQQAPVPTVAPKPTRPPRLRPTTTARPQTTRRITSKRPQAFMKTAFEQDFEYYDSATGLLGHIPEHSKVLLHSNGVIECLDQGSFPHPVSCKKFISCAKMETGNVLGWEYTCPKNLSFDPIGGMCNWSAELGCNE